MENTKIPKVVHFYWGNSKLPYMRYLTIWSFIKQNPEWEVKLYQPVQICKNVTWNSPEQKCDFVGKCYYSELEDLPIRKYFVDFDQFKLGNNTPEVYKSDLFRWYLLSTEGGFWSDMDILYFKPMKSLVVKSEVDTIVCVKEGFGHSIGFLLASKDNVYFKHVLEKALQCNNLNNYQSLGVSLINGNFPKVELIQNKFPKLNITNLEMDVCYQYYESVKRIQDLYIEGKLNFTKQSLGVHWYAGHPMAGAFVNKVNNTNWDNFIGLPIGQALRKVLVET